MPSLSTLHENIDGLYVAYLVRGGSPERRRRKCINLSGSYYHPKYFINNNNTEEAICLIDDYEKFEALYMTMEKLQQLAEVGHSQVEVVVL
jgi:hypothetical protein